MLAGQRGKVNSIAVAARDGVSPERLSAAVGAALAGAPVEVRTGEQDAAKQTADLEKDFGFVRTALLIFGAIALFVGAFVIYNTFTITVAQRTRELGLLRTLGASRRQVLRSVVLEAGVIGLLASVLGLLGGLLLAPGLRGLLKLIGGDLPSTASVILPRTIIVALGVGVVVTVLASLVPALRATRIAPIVALRDGLTAQTKVSRKRIVFATLLLLVGAGVMGYGLFGGASGSGAAATLGGGAVAVFLGVALFSPQLVRPIAWRRRRSAGAAVRRQRAPGPRELDAQPGADRGDRRGADDRRGARRLRDDLRGRPARLDRRRGGPRVHGRPVGRRQDRLRLHAAGVGGCGERGAGRLRGQRRALHAGQARRQEEHDRRDRHRPRDDRQDLHAEVEGRLGRDAAPSSAPTGSSPTPRSRTRRRSATASACSRRPASG